MFGILHWLLAFALLNVLLRDWRKALPVSLLLWIPCGPHGIGLVRGVFGELGAGSIVLCVLLLQPRPLREMAGLRVAALVVVITGGLLHLTTLNLVPALDWPVYEAGFASRGLVVAVGAAGLLAVACRCWWPAAWVALSLLTWNLGLLPSGNLWDHLLDMPLWVLSIGFLCASLRTRDR